MLFVVKATLVPSMNAFTKLHQIGDLEETKKSHSPNFVMVIPKRWQNANILAKPMLNRCVENKGLSPDVSLVLLPYLT